MFVFQPTGDQMVPPTDSGAVANCFGTLDAREKRFELGCTHNVDDVTYARIHRGGKGETGRAVFTINGAASPIRAEWRPTRRQVADLYAGNLYLVIRSGSFPKGEIRGQIVEGMSAYHFILDGEQVVPSTPVQSQGFCVGRVDAAETQLAFSCTHDVASPTAARVHAGMPGQNGPEVFDLGAPGDPIEAVWDLPAEQLATLRDLGLYVNVSSAAYPDGEIRGQVVHHGKCSSRETSRAKCNNGRLKTKVFKYSWFDPLDFCYDMANCITERTDGGGRAEVKWKNVPDGDHLVTTHYSCGETKYFLVSCQ